MIVSTSLPKSFGRGVVVSKDKITLSLLQKKQKITLFFCKVNEI